MATPLPLAAIIFRERHNPDLARAMFQFRKTFFVDELGWNLPVSGDLERDQFDTAAATYCALVSGNAVIGGFRAIRCDQPYLGQKVFPELALIRPYPARPDYWEISRLGLHRGYRNQGAYLYAAMFKFADLRQARALVAVVDQGHERLLGRIGIKTRRYGPPIPLGRQHGAPLSIVAGEISLAEQDERCLQFFEHLLEMLEIYDDTVVRRSARVSA